MTGPTDPYSFRWGKGRGPWRGGSGSLPAEDFAEHHSALVRLAYMSYC